MYHKMIIDELSAMNVHELDSLMANSGDAEYDYLNASDSPAGAELIERIRVSFTEANSDDRFDVPRKRAAVVHELADGDVPVYNADVVATFAAVEAAWHEDLSTWEGTGFDYGNRDYLDRDTALDMMIISLYVIIRHALWSLIEWADERTAEVEAEWEETSPHVWNDHDDDDGQHCPFSGDAVLPELEPVNDGDDAPHCPYECASSVPVSRES